MVNFHYKLCHIVSTEIWNTPKLYVYRYILTLINSVPYISRSTSRFLIKYLYDYGDMLLQKVCKDMFLYIHVTYLCR